MVVGIVFGILAVALFAGAFFSRRRFGLLGLALTAGATLSSIWAYNAGLVISATGLVPAGPLTNAVALSAVVLLPAVLLLFHGYTYKSVIGRIVGASLFAVLALAFLVEPIGYALALEGVAAEVYGWLVANKNLIISIGVIAAVVDLFFTKPAKIERDKRR